MNIILQVFEITTRKFLMCNDLNLAIANLRDLNLVAKISCPTVDLHSVVQELLKGRDVKDFVACGLRGIDNELESASVVWMMQWRLKD